VKYVNVITEYVSGKTPQNVRNLTPFFEAFPSWVVAALKTIPNSVSRFFDIV